jgi:branched-subunit amino acid ABC-type transport system permease component
MKDVISFAALLLILSLKPNGLFGREQGQRA